MLPLLPSASLATTPRGWEGRCREGVVALTLSLRCHRCLLFPVMLQLPRQHLLRSRVSPAPAGLQGWGRTVTHSALLGGPWASTGQSLRSQRPNCVWTLRPGQSPVGERTIPLSFLVTFSEGMGLGAVGGKRGVQGGWRASQAKAWRCNDRAIGAEVHSQEEAWGQVMEGP